MAKWGEGDPRWIVEERPDATNVNNWHWTELNATPWSKERLRKLLTGLEVISPEGQCLVTGVDHIEGEASANNRKAKLIFLYEWNLKLQWQGMPVDGGSEIAGEVEVPNLSDENDGDDLAIIVTTSENSEKAAKLKDAMTRDGVPLIRERLVQYVNELKVEFGRKAILPTKDKPKEESRPPVGSGQSVAQQFMEAAAESARMKPEAESSSTRSLHLKDEFKCTASNLFSAFLNEEMIKVYTRAPCKVDPRPGGRFEMFDRMVDGVFVDIKAPGQLTMKWRMATWPKDLYSDVKLVFDQKEDCTELQLEQNGIPDYHFENTQDGWRRHYFTAIKGTFGFGALLI